MALLATSGLVLSLLAAAPDAVAETAPTATSSAPGTTGTSAAVDPLEAATTAASAKARQTGARVQIAEADTENSTTYANPDGTFLLDDYAGPIRVRRGAGWAAIDPNLAVIDGQVRPKVAKAAISFSNGGPAGSSLATFGEGAKQVSLRWPTALPAPSLNGDTATYANVLPGADLKLIATPVSFDVHLVLRSRPTAPLALKLPISRAAGQTLQPLDAGAGQLLAADGTPAAKISRSFMWDANNEPRKKGPDGRKPVGQLLAGGGSELQLTPDAAFLADPKTQYPVTIDPSVNLPDNLDTGVTSYAPNTNYDADNTLWVGLSGYGTVYRSFIRFTNSAIKGKHVLSANLNLAQTGSGTCTAKALYVQGAAGMGPGTTWNTQPRRDGINWGNKSFNVGTQCNMPNGLISVPITGLVDAWSDNGYPSPEALALIAPSESDHAYWKMFASSETPYKPHITTTYNSYPTVPTTLQPSDGTTVNTVSPTLSGVVSDPDGGNVTGRFTITKNDGTVVYANAAGSQVTSGGRSGYTVPAGALTPATAYRWSMRSCDPTGDCSAATPSRSFTVSPTALCTGTAPGAASNLTVTPSQGAIRLGWVDSVCVGSADLDHYVLYSRAGSGQPLREVATCIAPCSTLAVPLRSTSPVTLVLRTYNGNGLFTDAAETAPAQSLAGSELDSLPAPTVTQARQFCEAQALALAQALLPGSWFCNRGSITYTYTASGSTTPSVQQARTYDQTTPAPPGTVTTMGVEGQDYPPLGDDDGHRGYYCGSPDEYCERSYDGRAYDVVRRLFYGKSTGSNAATYSVQTHGRIEQYSLIELRQNPDTRGFNIPFYRTTTIKLLERYEDYDPWYYARAGIECRQSNDGYDSDCGASQDDGYATDRNIEDFAFRQVTGNELTNSAPYFAKYEFEFQEDGPDDTDTFYILPSLSTSYFDCASRDCGWYS